MKLSEVLFEIKNDRCIRRICSNKYYGYNPEKVQFFTYAIDLDEFGNFYEISQSFSDKISFSIDDFFADDWLVD